MIAFMRLRGYFNLYAFQQDNSLANRDSEIVELLARKTPDFLPSDLLRDDTVNSFSSANQTKFIFDAGLRRSS